MVIEVLDIRYVGFVASYFHPLLLQRVLQSKIGKGITTATEKANELNRSLKEITKYVTVLQWTAAFCLWSSFPTALTSYHYHFGHELSFGIL